MKKTLKVLLVVAFLLAVLVGLTGCGNKLTATKESDIEGQKVKEKIEVSFKKDKVSKVKMTYTFDDKDTAKKYVDEYNESMKALVELAKSFGSEEEIPSMPEMKLSGKSAVMELDAKEYAEMASEDSEELTKDAIKEALEKEGYTVK